MSVEGVDVPQLHVFIGPNGSGKSAIFRMTKLSDTIGWLNVNPDIIAKNLTDIEDPRQRWIKAAEIAERYRRGYLSQRRSFSFETVGSTKEKLEFISEAKDSGYDVNIVFVTTCHPDINKQRVRQRVSDGGHDVEDSKIESRYIRTMGLLTKYVDVSDRFTAYDNSGNHPINVFRKDGPNMVILRNPKAIPWVDSILMTRYPQSRRVLKGPSDASVYLNSYRFHMD